MQRCSNCMGHQQRRSMHSTERYSSCTWFLLLRPELDAKPFYAAETRHEKTSRLWSWRREKHRQQTYATSSAIIQFGWCAAPLIWTERRTPGISLRPPGDRVSSSLRQLQWMAALTDYHEFAAVAGPSSSSSAANAADVANCFYKTNAAVRT